MPPSVRSRLAAAAIVATLVLPAAAGASVAGPGGAPVPNTADGAQLIGQPGCATGAGAGCTALAQPGSPGDDPQAAMEALGHPGGPEDDLAAALDALAVAEDAAAARAARDEALAILVGDPLPGRVYSGIPLLHWNAPLKVRRVPAGGVVDVTEVRTPGQSASDTWLLDFEDPSQGYTIRYRVSEVGGAQGTELRPAPLLADGDVRLGGLHSVLQPLGAPSLLTGTRDSSRFTAARGLAAGGREETRLATQVIGVRMPPPGLTRAILDPATRETGSGLLTLRPATPARLAAARAKLGLRDATPTAAERRAAIGRLAVTAPERQLWADLDALDPDSPGFLAEARALGDRDRALVGSMRTRDQVPPGVASDPTAQVTVVLMNNEAYVSRERIGLVAGDELRVQVVNRDGFEHDLEVLGLHGRRAVLGAEDWGRFDWDELSAGQPALAPEESRTIVVRPQSSAFALWIGDPDSGEAAATVIELDRGPQTDSLRPHDVDSAGPLHQAIDADGALWVGLTGIDAIVRVSPGRGPGGASRTTVLMPGGRHSPTSDRFPLAPADVAVDGRGIVWSTLTLGNAVARIDPAQVRDGSSAGVRIYPLTACPPEACAVPFPPEPGAPPTRQPLQLEVSEDGAGGAQVWFTEAGADRIGLLRVAPDGTEIGQTHFTCGCGAPFGLALDAAGAVWFTEGVDNRLGRLTPDLTAPGSSAAAALHHFAIPSAVAVEEPELAPGVVMTSNPHSVTVDARGRIWFTETATGKLGLLEPWSAEPQTTKGMSEFALPDTPFGAAAVPADLTVDRAGRVFWADEYGDAVGVFDARGDRAQWRTTQVLRPAARRSLTDSPVLTSAGDLWVVEHGANLLTRFAGVSAGSPGPRRAPQLTADLDRDALAADGIAEADRATVAVNRAGRTVARATAAVRDGALRIAAGDWEGEDADHLRGGDRLVVSPSGAHPRADLVVDVAEIDARVDGDAVTGTARVRGAAVPGSVTVDLGGRRDAPVSAADGTWRLALGTGAAPTAGTAAWTQGTPALRLTTVAGIRGVPAPPEPPARVEPRVTPTPAPAPAITPAPVAPPVATPAPRPEACPARVWLAGSPSRPAVPFLGGRADALRRCLGAPVRRSASRGTERLAFGGGLEAEVRGGRVTALAVTGPAWTAARGGLRVGAAASAVRRSLPTARRTSRPRGWRAALALGAGRATVSIRLTHDGRRVAGITVTAAR